MSWLAVAVSIFVSLVVGSLFGLASVKLAGLFGRIGAAQPTEPNIAAPA
jgi:hypothetical protein